MQESEFIAQLRARASHAAARGLNDDCAVLGDLVLTHDMLVIGTHVMGDCAPEDVAWKLVGVNLSDLAAKGAEPIGVMLGYMLGTSAWDARFAAALGDALSHYDTQLLGGDTVATPAQSADTRAFGLTAIGRAAHMPVPSRSGARPDDTLWVTGQIGLAMLGYLGETGQVVRDDVAIARYRRPAPRLTEGRALAPLVTAMMDVSDGLLLDAQRLAQASGVTIAIESSAVPLPAAIMGDTGLSARAMRWGDDYELLFTLPSGVEPSIAARRIGAVHGLGAHHLLIDGAAPDASQPLGWEHGG